MTAPGPDFDLFLSYSHADGDFAAELAAWAAEQRLKTFFDRAQLSPGLRWIVAIERAIESSGAVAILIGAHGIGNTQQYERELALVKQTRDAAFPVIPVLLPGCEVPPTGFLELLTWVDLRSGTTLGGQPERLQSLLAAIRSESVASAAARSTTCPYMGLEPFHEEDAAFFCGRDKAIADLVQHVQTDSFVAVVGRSGSGKSSLVFAGLLPALRRQRDTIVWDVVSLRPSSWPLHSLAEAFGSPPVGGGPAARDAYLEGEVDALRRGDASRLARIIERRLAAAVEKPDRLLIYVDQWEELYAMAPAGSDAAASSQHAADVEQFISLLLGVAAPETSRARVVVTMRADFYGPVIRHPRLSQLLPQQQVNIGPMLQEDLRSAIVSPASKVGLSFAPQQLVEQILADVGTDEGMLPLLQYALRETWLRREGAHLTADGYTAAGGVRGAIQAAAERTFLSLTDKEKASARRLFLGLVRPGEGREDTRARIAIPDDAAAKAIVAKFADRKARLLITGSEAIAPPAAGSPDNAGGQVRATVEVAHEALIRTWPMLREWLDANREKLRARSAVLQAKREWEDHQQPEGLLLPSGFQLERGRALLADPGDVPVDDIADYVQRSIAREERRLEAERAAELEEERRIADADRRAREAAERAQQEAEARAASEENARRHAEQARTKLRRWLAVSVFAGSAAVIALFFAAAQREAAVANLRLAFLTKAEQSLAEQRPSTAFALANSFANPDLVSTLFAPFDWLVNRMAARSDPPEADLRLRSIAQLTRAAATAPLRAWRTQIATAASLSPDGQVVAIGTSDGHIYLEPSDGTTATLHVAGHRHGRIVSLAFVGSADRLVSATESEAVLWNLATGQSTVWCSDPAGIADLAVDAAGRYVVWASKDGRVSVRDIATDTVRVLDEHKTPAVAVSVSTDGSQFASAGQDGTVKIRNLADPALSLVREVRTQRQDIIGIALHAPDKRLATASLSGPIELWSDHEGALADPTIVPAVADQRWLVRFSPDGKLLAVGSWHGSVSLWNTADLSHRATIDGHDHRVNDVAFSHDAARLVTASESGVSRLWDLVSLRPAFIEAAVPEAGQNIVGEYSADGEKFAMGGKDGRVRMYRVGKDGHLARFCEAGEKTDRWIIGLAFLSAAEFAAIELHQGINDVLRLWKIDAGACVAGEEHARGFVDGLASTSAKQALAWSNESGQIFLLVDRHKKEVIRLPAAGAPPIHSKSIAAFDFNRDGTLLASAGNDGTLALWDVQGRTLKHVKKGPKARLNTVKFSPDGKYVAAAGDGEEILVWSTDSIEPARKLFFYGNTNRLAFNADSSLLAAGSDTRTVTVWSTADWQRVFQLNRLVGVRSVYGFHPSRGDLAFDGEDGTLRIIPGDSFRPAPPTDLFAPAVKGIDVKFDNMPVRSVEPPKTPAVEASTSACAAK